MLTSILLVSELPTALQVLVQLIILVLYVNIVKVGYQGTYRQCQIADYRFLPDLPDY